MSNTSDYLQRLESHPYRRFKEGQNRSFERNPDYFAEPILNGDASVGGVTIRYLGCNGLYITDGETNLLVDPYFTRCDVTPNRRSGRHSLIQPNESVVRDSLEHAGITRADALIVTHGHWDHALDIGVVWQCLQEASRPNELLVYGSTTAKNIAVGHGVPAENCRVVSGYTSQLRKGRFNVSFLRGAHMPYPLGAMNRSLLGTRATQPVIPPARVDAYAEGTNFALLIAHPTGTILNQGSANYVSGYYRRLFSTTSYEYTETRPRPKVLILAVGGYNLLHVWSRIPRHFYDEVILPTDPEVVYLSHWEEFHKDRQTLDKPLKWKSWCYRALELLREDDRFGRSMRRGLFNQPQEGSPGSIITGSSRSGDLFGQFSTRTPDNVISSCRPPGSPNEARRDTRPIKFLPLLDPVRVLPA